MHAYNYTTSLPEYLVSATLFPGLLAFATLTDDSESKVVIMTYAIQSKKAVEPKMLAWDQGL